MTTVHKVHFQGGIESLSFTRADGVRVGVGVFQPGTYDVDTTDTEEHVQITSGELVVNGDTYISGMIFVVPKGTRLVFEAREPSTYFATYHK